MTSAEQEQLERYSTELVLLLNTDLLSPPKKKKC
jgi:hypothetical protein